ncbi:unnamed protein product [Arctogadus glacialis]
MMSLRKDRDMGQRHQTIEDQQVELEEVMNLGIQMVLDEGDPPPIRIILPVFGGGGFQYETHAFTLAFHRLIWENPTIRFTLVTHSVEEYEELTEQLTDRVTHDHPRNRGTSQAESIYGPQRGEPTQPGAPPAQGTQGLDHYRPPAFNYEGLELERPHHPAFWVNPERDHASVLYSTLMNMATPDENPAPIMVRPTPVRALINPNRGRDPMHSQVRRTHGLRPVPDYRYPEPRRQQREESHTLPSHKHQERSHRPLKTQREQPPTRNQYPTEEQPRSTSKQRPQPRFLEERMYGEEIEGEGEYELHNPPRGKRQGVSGYRGRDIDPDKYPCRTETMYRDPGYPSRKHPVLTKFEEVPEPRAPEQWDPDWYAPSGRERQLVERAPTSTQIHDYPGITKPWKESYIASGYDACRLGCITRDRSVMTKARVDWEDRQNIDSQPHSDAHTRNRCRDGTYSPEPHTSPTRRKEWRGQGHAIPHGGAEGEDQAWEPVYSPACTQPTTEEPPTTRPLKIGPLSYSAPAGMKYYTQTPIQGRGGEDYSSQGVGTKPETTKNLLKLMPDRQPREPEKDYVRRLIASGITPEQLDVDMIRMRLQAKERIEIPRSMTVAEWASQYLPSPGENPIDESMSASSNLVRTGMTSMLMAVNNLLDKGATPTDLEKFFGMNPKGGDLAAGWRIWSTEQRRMELILYDRRRASELKEKGQNNKEETPPNYYRDPREERKVGNSQDGRYNNQQFERKSNRPPQNGRGPTNHGQSGFGQNQQRGGPTTRSQTVNARAQDPQNPNSSGGVSRPEYLTRDDYMKLPREERDRRRTAYEEWRGAGNQWT